MDALAEVTAHMKGRKIDTLVDFRLIHSVHEWRHTVSTFYFTVALGLLDYQKHEVPA